MLTKLVGFDLQRLKEALIFRHKKTASFGGG